MKMIEKMAWAICREKFRGTASWTALRGPARVLAEMVDERWHEYIPAAKAALTTLLEPDEGMVEAASRWLEPNMNRLSINDAFTAAIQHALAEGE
jgi:hypothetical protein